MSMKDIKLLMSVKNQKFQISLLHPYQEISILQLMHLQFINQKKNGTPQVIIGIMVILIVIRKHMDHH